MKERKKEKKHGFYLNLFRLTKKCQINSSKKKAILTDEKQSRPQLKLSRDTQIEYMPSGIFLLSIIYSSILSAFCVLKNGVQRKSQTEHENVARKEKTKKNRYRLCTFSMFRLYCRGLGICYSFIWCRANGKQSAVEHVMPNNNHEMARSPYNSVFVSIFYPSFEMNFPTEMVWHSVYWIRQ